MLNKVYPNFPKDRTVIETADQEKWYKINYEEKALYVPTSSILRSNPSSIDQYVEAIAAFAKSPNPERESVWKEDYVFTLNYLKRYSGLLACDIETHRVEYEDNGLLAIGFAGQLVNGKEFTVTVTEFDDKTIEDLQEVFSRPSITFIWHNGKFDTTRLKYLVGIDARIDEDTMLMHYTGINERKGTHSLKDLGQLYLQAPKWDDELQDFRKTWCRENKVKLKEFTYDLIPTDKLLPYLKLDCLATLRLFQVFKGLVREESEFIYRVILQASNVYKEIELNGIEHNLEHSKEVEKILIEQKEKAEKEMQEVIDTVWNPVLYMEQTGAKMPAKKRDFNPKSSKQLKWLIEQLVGKDIKSTDKAALLDLLENVDDIDSALGKKFIVAIGANRKADKYLDTYVTGLRRQTCKDNRIRCSFSLHGTETGRLSSSEPNMQNIPRNALIKNLLTVKPGYKFVQLDYSQAELRVLTFLSKDPTLIKVYLDGRDLHDEMSIKIHGPGFTKEQRVIIKSLNFGIAYGRGAGSIAQMFKMSKADAQKIVNDWYAAVPLVKKFIQGKRSEPSRGITPTTPFGRQRHFIVTSENSYHVENESINFYVQSIASDLTLISVVKIHHELKKLGIDAKIVNTVHDSIIFEVKDEPELISQVVKLGKSVMETVPREYLKCDIIPFKADAEVGYIWGDLEKYKEEK